MAKPDAEAIWNIRSLKPRAQPSPLHENIFMMTTSSLEKARGPDLAASLLSLKQAWSQYIVRIRWPVPTRTDFNHLSDKTIFPLGREENKL